MNRTCFEGPFRRISGSSQVAILALLPIFVAAGSFSGEPVVPPNDLCIDAIPLTCEGMPGSVLGTNIGATGTSTPFCGANTGAEAVWYTVIGNGSNITISTCSIETNFDTRINVYTGSCADELNMACVTGNDDAAGNPLECQLGGNNLLSRVTWLSTDAVTYFVVVSGGFNIPNGTFDLILDCEVPVELQRFTIE